jgi:peptide/nickel transport system ATP-binding protein
MSDSAKPHLLAVDNLSVEFHTRQGIVKAVNDVSLYLDRGETLAILGESGSGKSVSAMTIMGLVDTPPGHIRSGSVRLDGVELIGRDDADRRDINGTRVAMIFQDTLAALNPVYTVGWQIAESLRAHGVAAGEARSRALALMERVGIPEAARRYSDYPHQFSGGQRQRIMIAIAIANEPDILLADEPTSALDVTVQAGILKLLKDLQRERGMGILIITHDLGVVAEIADRVVVMQNGEAVETGAVRDVFENPQHAYTKRLLDSVPGRHGFSVNAPDDRGEALIEVRDLAKHHAVTSGLMRSATGAVVKALDGVSFTLKRGETLGVVGESGSGKTTLARTLLGLEEPTAGTALFRGESMFGRAPKELTAMRRRIQVVFQDPTASLNPRMTVEQIISEPWAIHPGVLDKAKWHDRVAELLEQVGLKAEHAKRFPHQFSGGQRQRIAIARALALDPDVIICDEAVSALDVSIQAQVIELLRKIKRERGLSYLFIAHDLAVVRDFAERTLVMYRGKIVEQGPTLDIFTNPQHEYTQQLLASSPSADPTHHVVRKAG